MNASVGARIAEERDRLSLSQEAFAARVGVSFSSQRRYESGSRSPSTVYLSNLRECGVDADYVLTGSRNSNMPLHRINLALRLAISDIGEKLGCEPAIAQYLGSYPSLSTAIFENGDGIPDEVVDEFVKSCQVHLDTELLSAILDGVDTATQAINGCLTSKKKAQAVAMLYRSFKPSGKVDPAIIEETVKLASS